MLQIRIPCQIYIEVPEPQLSQLPTAPSHYHTDPCSVWWQISACGLLATAHFTVLPPNIQTWDTWKHYMMLLHCRLLNSWKWFVWPHCSLSLQVELDTELETESETLHEWDLMNTSFPVKENTQWWCSLWLCQARDPPKWCHHRWGATTHEAALVTRDYCPSWKATAAVSQCSIDNDCPSMLQSFLTRDKSPVSWNL